jgi:ABC-type transport system substrate-binding protein
MTEAGFPDGFSFTMVHQPDSVDTRAAEIEQAQLAEVGIQMELVPVELTQSVTEYFTDRQHNAGHFGWTGRPDPSMTFFQIFSADTFFNAGKYEIEGFAELLTQASATTDIAERNEVFRQIVELTLEESIIVPLFFRATTDAFVDGVQGYVPTLLSKPKFDEVTLGQ